MIVNKFDFKWAYKSIKNNIMTVKFEVAFQTTSLQLENYCKKNYNDLLIRNLTPFTVEQLKRLYEMRQYLKKNTKSSDIEDLLKYLHEKQWFGDIPLSAKCASIEIHDYDCKYLPMIASNIPYLVYNGILIVDLLKIIQYYIKQQYFRIIEKDNKFVKEVITLIMTKPFPKIITQDNIIIMKNIILDIITKLLSTPSTLSLMIEKVLKIKNIHIYKKEIRWENDTTLKIIINDYVKLLKLKITQNAVPLTLTGLYVYHKQKQHQKQIKTITNIYNIMLDTIEKELKAENKL